MTMQKEPAIQVAVITGASSGLGRELAVQAAARGMLPLLLARSHKGLQETRRRVLNALPDDDRFSGWNGITDNIELCIPCDLATDPEDAALRVGLCLEQIAGYCESGGAQLALLVNNAGSASFGDFREASMADLRGQIRLNLEYPVLFTRVLAGKLEKGSQIINVASTAALCPGPGMALYYASKAGMLSWSRALEYELGPAGIDVLSYCPGPLKTGFVEKAGIPVQDYLQKAPDAGAAARNLMKRVYSQRKRRGIYVYPWRYSLLATLQRFIPQGIALAAVRHELLRRKGVSD